MLILQWNARSLIANGQEFKSFLNGVEYKPDIICVEETWLKPSTDFVFQGYVCIRGDRERGNGEDVLPLLGKEFLIEKY